MIYLYTLAHSRVCAIKLNTASAARGACAAVITTLFLILRALPQQVASGTFKLLIVKWVKTYSVPEEHLKYTASWAFFFLVSFIYLCIFEPLCELVYI